MSAGTPSPSIAIITGMRALLTHALEQERFTPAAATDDAVMLFTSVITGVVSQQNGQQAAHRSHGRLVRQAAGPALETWLARYPP